MMIINRDDFCFRDSDYFESPERTTRPDPGYFDLAALPDGWDVDSDDAWKHVSHEENSIPDQGWKIHISAALHNAQDILDIAAEVCLAHRTDFKFVPHLEGLYARNAKYADRRISGKFLTAYPAGEAELEKLVHHLEARLAGNTGPYILTDLRWEEGPIYLRYGAFRHRECRDTEGNTVPAIAAPDGTLVPDSRNPSFDLPDFAPVPAFLKGTLERRLATDDETAQFPYVVTNTLHISNGGGVYVAHHVDLPDIDVVLKEARPYAGLDPHGVPAGDRLEQEAWALKKLAHLDSAPAFLGLHKFWEHQFLVQEFVPGVTLYQWVAKNFPFSEAMDNTAYSERAETIIRNLRATLQDVHAAGVALRDLQPRNILIDDSDELHLIDFETACETTTEKRAPFGTPGFVPPAKCDAVTTDLYGLSRVAMHMFSPVTPLGQLTPDFWEQQIVHIAQEFPQSAVQMLKELAESVGANATSAAADHRAAHRSWSMDDVIEGTPLTSIGEGLRNSRRADDADERVYPGDAEQFFGLGTANLSTGLAGVALVRHRAFMDVTDDSRLLEQWSTRPELATPELLTGGIGIASALAEIGCITAATSLALRSTKHTEPAEYADISLRSGYSGTALGLMGMQRLSPEIRHAEGWVPIMRALAIVQDRYPGSIISSASTNHKPIGLLNGWSGAALAFIAMAELSGDEEWVDRAVRAIEADLAECIEAPDGSLQVDDQVRMMPYLDEGSAGIAVALSALPQTARSAGHDQAMSRILRACCARSYANAGLMSGRAGTIAALAAIPDHIYEEEDRSEALDRQIRRLWLHAFSTSSDQGTEFAGHHNLKIASDYSTGTAGVLAALLSVRASPSQWLPVPYPDFLIPSLGIRPSTTAKEKKEEVNHEQRTQPAEPGRLRPAPRPRLVHLEH